MLELFAVRGQMALPFFLHATLAASTWVASLHASNQLGSSPGPAAPPAWRRVQLLAPITAVSGLLIAAQLGIFWRNAFAAGGATLLLPTLVALLTALGAGATSRSSRVPPLQGARVAAMLTAVSGACALVGLAWLGHPAGAAVSDAGTVSVRPLAAFFSSTALARIAHFGLAATTLGASFLASGAARHQDAPTLRWSLRTALVALMLQLPASLVSLRTAGQNEPDKLAAMAAQFEDVASAPVQLFAWPYDFGEYTEPGVPMPGLLSTIVHGDESATVEGLISTPIEDRPPVAALYVSMHVKAAIGLLTWLLLAVAALRARAGAFPRYLLSIAVVPMTTFGWGLLWLVTELGRYPWTIRGILRAGQAAWLPYGMAPTAALWILASFALTIVAVIGCRRLTPPPVAVEPTPEPAT